jgi:hypothetical protein
MAKTLIVLGKAWLWATAALTLWPRATSGGPRDSGKWRNQGMLSFSNALEVFAVLAPGILLLIVGRHLRARHDKFVRNFAASAGVTDPRDE